MSVPPRGGRGFWLMGVVSGQKNFQFYWARGASYSRFLLGYTGSRGCFLLFSFFPLFSGLLFGFVCSWFSLGLEWPLLCLRGSRVLNQGAGYGVLECVFFFLDATIR